MFPVNTPCTGLYILLAVPVISLFLFDRLYVPSEYTVYRTLSYWLFLLYTVYSLGTYNLTNKNREIIGTASKIESCTRCIHWEHTTSCMFPVNTLCTGLYLTGCSYNFSVFIWQVVCSQWIHCVQDSILLAVPVISLFLFDRLYVPNEYTVFVLFSAIVLSGFLWFTDSDYPFGIFTIQPFIKT
jgi:hypothetical protein